MDDNTKVEYVSQRDVPSSMTRKSLQMHKKLISELKEKGFLAEDFKDASIVNPEIEE